MEKEYVIIVHDPLDLPTLEEELAASYGNQFVADREVTCQDPRPGSKYQSQWMLTDEEAATLSNDPRIKLVEEKFTGDVVLCTIQEGDFRRGWYSPGEPQFVNYALRRVNDAVNEYGGGRTPNNSANNGEPNIHYAGLDGTGVDIVIVDSGVDHHHPDLFDAEGNTRLQQIDWTAVTGITGHTPEFYQDADGHGTACASVAAGLVHGFAKNAHIYSIPITRNNSEVSFGRMADMIRLWHSRKNDPGDVLYTGRPTIVNMSFNYGTFTINYNEITGGSYRGQGWDRGDLTNEDIARIYGLPVSGTNFVQVMRTGSASINEDMHELSSIDGIHVFHSSGNTTQKCDVPGGPDYNNRIVTLSQGAEFYNRPGGPYSTNAFIIGNIEHIGSFGPNNDKDRIARCGAGPATHWYSPGNGTMAARSSDASTSGSTRYQDSTQFFQRYFSGTSSASPISCGVAALHLQAEPVLSSEELRDRMIEDTKKDVIHDEIENPGGAADQQNGLTTGSIAGGHNRFLFNRFNKPSLSVSGDFTGNIKGLSIE